mgnify:CR=1 FL=1
MKKHFYGFYRILARIPHKALSYLGIRWGFSYLPKQSPSKLIDYAIARRPVLDISTNLTYEEIDHFKAFVTGNYDARIQLPDLSNYDIRNICHQIINLTQSSR